MRPSHVSPQFHPAREYLWCSSWWITASHRSRCDRWARKFSRRNISVNSNTRSHLLRNWGLWKGKSTYPQEKGKSLAPGIPQSPAADDSIHTAPSLQVSPHDSVVIFPPEISEGPNLDVRPPQLRNKTTILHLLKSLNRQWAPIPATHELKHPNHRWTLLHILNLSLEHSALATTYVATQRHRAPGLLFARIEQKTSAAELHDEENCITKRPLIQSFVHRVLMIRQNRVTRRLVISVVG